MADTRGKIISDISGYFKKTEYEDCYVGITSGVESRLFGDHKVSRDGRWLYRISTSNTVAREIEDFFLAAGMDGGSGGGDVSSKTVYSYLKTDFTDP